MFQIIDKVSKGFLAWGCLSLVKKIATLQHSTLLGQPTIWPILGCLAHVWPATCSKKTLLILRTTPLRSLQDLINFATLQHYVAVSCVSLAVWLTSGLLRPWPTHTFSHHRCKLIAISSSCLQWQKYKHNP